MATNQSRRRPAEMVGVVSVTDEWTVAHHQEMSRSILSETETTFVLDAGTGMYLNAILLDTPLAPKVDPHIRERAITLSEGSSNPRRASREIELDLAGAGRRGSIWDGAPIYDSTLIYIRPDRTQLDKRIERRSNHIIQYGVAEAELITKLIIDGERISQQVLNAIGIRELLDLLSATISEEDARSKMSARTRQLARRQMRWFDKLTRTLSGRATVEVVQEADTEKVLHTLHDTMIA